MKKVMKSRLFIVILTMIVCISGTLYAVNEYYATDILYNTSDGKSMSVSEALNDLYANKNNNGYKVYEFSNILATVGGTHYIYKDDSFVFLTSEKTTSTDCDVSESADGRVYFSIDLDFIPKKIVNANICLTVGGSTSTEPYNIRMRSGYEASSTTETYRYTDRLCAQYGSNSIYNEPKTGITSIHNKIDNNEVKGNNYYYIKENKLYFVNKIYRAVKSDGTCQTGTVNSFYQVRGTSFYLSGTIVYEE